VVMLLVALGVLGCFGGPNGGVGSTGGAGGQSGTTTSASTAGAGGTGGSGGAPQEGFEPASQTVNAGGRVRGEGREMVFTLGQPTQNQGKTTSPGYRMQGGLAGENGSLP